MKIFEKLLNIIASKISVKGVTTRSFSKPEFRSLVMKLHENYSFENSESINQFTLRVNGSFFSKILIQKVDNTKELYESTQSRFTFKHHANGIVEIDSFEHMLGSKNERREYQSILETRLFTILNVLDTIEL